MNIKSVIILSLALVCGLVSSQADIIHLKNGKAVEGFVKERRGEDIIIETVGGVYTFKSRDIDRIEPTSRLKNLLTLAKAEGVRGNYPDSIKTYTGALELAETNKERQAIRAQREKVVRSYVAQIAKHDPLKSGLQDIEEIKRVERMVSDHALLSILQKSKLTLDSEVVQVHYEEAHKLELRRDFEKSIKHYTVVLEHYPENSLAQNLDKRIASLSFDWGVIEYDKSHGLSAIAQDAFRNVLKTYPDHSLSHYYLGIMADNEGNHNEALIHLRQVDPEQLSLRQQRRLGIAINTVREALKPTPTPRPKIIYTPPPTPTPPPTITQKLSNWVTGWGGTFSSFLGDMIGGDVSEYMPESWDWVLPTLMGIGLFLVVWYFPQRMVGKDLPKRAALYRDWRKIVKYTGLLGMIWYYIEKFRSEEVKSRCPACERAIDDVDIYEDFEFDQCPYCGIEIKPLFTMQGVIESQTEQLAKKFVRGKQEIDDNNSDEITSILRLVLIHGHQNRISDLLIEPSDKMINLRFCIDGITHETFELKKEIAPLLMYGIKTIAKLDPSSTQISQEGLFRKILEGDEINYRISIQPTQAGEKALVRTIDPTMAKMSMERMGFRNVALAQYRSAIASIQGLVLVVGPAQSGKTGLVYSSIHSIKQSGRQIVSIESPIEFPLEGGVQQINYLPEGGEPYESIVMSVLQQNPEVIVSSSIPNLDTANQLLHAAQNGCLVLASLNAADASTALTYLLNLGVDGVQLASALQTVVGMRLVRKLCPHCKKQSTASARELQLFGDDGRILEAQPIARPRGCRECHQSGYIGRTGVYEVLEPDQIVNDLIETSGNVHHLREAAKESGMKTLREEGLSMVLMGTTSLEEIIRVLAGEAS